LEEMKNLLVDIKDMNDINKNLAQMINDQHEIIETIEEQAVFTEAVVEKGVIELKKAEKYKSANIFRKGLLLTTGLLVMTSPIGLLIGTKAGLVAGAASLVSGGGFIVAKKISQ